MENTQNKEEENAESSIALACGEKENIVQEPIEREKKDEKGKSIVEEQSESLKKTDEKKLDCEKKDEISIVLAHGASCVKQSMDTKKEEEPKKEEPKKKKQERKKEEPKKKSEQKKEEPKKEADQIKEYLKEYRKGIIVEKKHVAAEPILQSFSSTERGLNCLDGVTEIKKLKMEQNLLLCQKRFRSARDIHDITIGGRDKLKLKNATRDYFCLLQGGEGRSYIALMEKLLCLRNQLIEQEDEYVRILQGKCSKNKEDVLLKLVVSRRQLEQAEKIYLISRRRYFVSTLSAKADYVSLKYSDEDLLTNMINQRKEIMELEVEYVGLLQAGATYFDHILSRHSKHVLQRAVSSNRDLLGLEELFSIGERTWSMFEVEPIYFRSLLEVASMMISIRLYSSLEQQEMYPNLVPDSNIDYKINRLEMIANLRKEYLMLEDEYLCLLQERYTKNHDGTSTSFHVHQIHLEYVWEYLLEIILRWRNDFKLLEDDFRLLEETRIPQLEERYLRKSAYGYDLQEIVKLSKAELKEAEEEYCQLIRDRQLTILDSISLMDVTQIYAKYNNLELFDHIESLRMKIMKLEIGSRRYQLHNKYEFEIIGMTRERLREAEEQYFCHLKHNIATKNFLQPPLGTKASESFNNVEEEEEFLTMLFHSIKSRNIYCSKCMTCINNVIQSALKLEDDDELFAKIPYEDEEVPDKCFQVLHKFLNLRSICCPTCMNYVRMVVTIRHVQNLKDRFTTLDQTSTASIPNKAGEAYHQEDSVIMMPRDEIITPQQGNRVRWKIQTSIVLGGLIESITSLVIVTIGASANISDGNIVALALTNLIAGLFIIRHNLSGLQKKNHTNKGCTRIEVEGNHFKEVLKEKMYYLLYFIIAFLSFLFFGLVPPFFYALASFKTRNKNLKIIAAAGASFSCTIFLAIQKAHIQKSKSFLVYVKISAIYLSVGVGAFGISYLVGYMFGHLAEKLPWVL